MKYICIIGFILLIYFEIKINHKKRLKYNIGTWGENKLYMALKRYFPKKQIFRNVYFFNGEKSSEIDIIAINRRGIYVFENKHYQGEIYETADKKYWKQIYNDYNTRMFYNPVLQNASHCKILKEIFPNIPIFSYVTFSSNAKLYINDGYKKKVLYIKEIGENIRKNQKNISKKEIKYIVEKLKKYTQTSETDKKRHIENVSKIKGACL